MSTSNFTTPDGSRFAPLDEQALRELAEQIRARIAAALARHARQAGRCPRTTRPS